MNVAWVSSRDYDRMEGGAELADVNMWRTAPEEVHIELVQPGFDPHRIINDFDKVVVSTMRGFSGPELGVLGLVRPAIWCHDMEFEGHWIHSKADPFIALTPEHLAREANLGLAAHRATVNPGYFDTTGLEPKDHKVEAAVWAARDIWHKGLDRAQAWADEKGITLCVLKGASHESVISALQVSKYFVLLSHIFDPGPWTVIEAQLCGCELIVDNVGFFDEPREALKNRIDSAGDQFWADVLAA